MIQIHTQERAKEKHTSHQDLAESAIAAEKK